MGGRLFRGRLILCYESRIGVKPALGRRFGAQADDKTKDINK